MPGGASTTPTIMSQFFDVARLDQLACGAGRTFRFAGTDVALFHVGGRLFCVDDACLRCGITLSRGIVRDDHVACAGCDWRYDLASGAVIGVPSLRLETFPTRIIGAWVLIAASSRPLPPAATAG